MANPNDIIAEIKGWFRGAVDVEADQIKGRTYCLVTSLDRLRLTDFHPIGELKTISLYILKAEYIKMKIDNDGREYDNIPKGMAHHLINHGIPVRDIVDMDKAIPYMRYTYEKNGREYAISKRTAIKRLGVEEWIWGVQRAAFHSTALRMAKDGTEILFEYKKNIDER